VYLRALAEVAGVFLRLGMLGFGGPAAHIALIEQECVERRKWITREELLDLLAVASLIPGPTSTELAMHVGRRRAGWLGLVVAGLAFITPAALLVGILASLYVRGGGLPAVTGMLQLVQPVVLVVIAQAVLPLGRSVVRTAPLAALAVVAGVLALMGVPDLRVLILAGVAYLVVARAWLLALWVVLAAGATLLAQTAVVIPTRDVAAFFLQIGSLLFGSGYVLLPVLQDQLVGDLGWITDAQLIDAITAGQVTPGPVFTTATFIGYLLGGPSTALVATVAIFLPGFVFSAISSALLPRLRASRAARRFLEGVSAAAIALIAVTLVDLARATLTTPGAAVIGVVAAVGMIFGRVPPLWALGAAAATGLGVGLWG
jgi:chromate transporter